MFRKAKVSLCLIKRLPKKHEVLVTGVEKVIYDLCLFETFSKRHQILVSSI